MTASRCCDLTQLSWFMTYLDPWLESQIPLSLGTTDLRPLSRTRFHTRSWPVAERMRDASRHCYKKWLISGRCGPGIASRIFMPSQPHIYAVAEALCFRLVCPVVYLSMCLSRAPSVFLSVRNNTGRISFTFAGNSHYHQHIKWLRFGRNCNRNKGPGINFELTLASVKKVLTPSEWINKFRSTH